MPWLPSQIEQREGRIERQGNQNDEIGIYAYATLGSTDATMWQNNERKQRFINAAMSGDRSVRRIEDAGSQVSQFAMAKAIASGDPRLMQKAGLEAEIARLERQRAAHFDDQHAVRRAVYDAERAIATAERRIVQVGQDIERRRPTRGDAFEMTVDGVRFTERPKAGGALLNLLRNLDIRQQSGDWTVAEIGGFGITASMQKTWRKRELEVLVALDRTGEASEIEFSVELTALGLISRLEHALEHFDAELAQHRRLLVENQRRVADYAPRLGTAFALQAELEAKAAELAALEADLAQTGKDTAEAAQAEEDAAMLRLKGRFAEELEDEATEAEAA